MDLRYRFNNQKIATGERTVFYAPDGRLFVQTSLKAQDDATATYNLREIYDASVPAPVLPPGGDISLDFMV